MNFDFCERFKQNFGKIDYGRITILSGNACERGQVTGLDSLFFRIWEQFIFGEFFQSYAKFAFLSIFSHGTEKISFEPKSDFENPDKKKEFGTWVEK